MKCPVDGSDLLMTERQGVEIDYCPKCRGVWLDRGELDKIIDRSGPDKGVAPETPSQAPFLPPIPQQQAYNPGNHPRGHKRKGFLGELFDFD